MAKHRRDDMNHAVSHSQGGMSRRAFLQTSTLVVAAGLAAACGDSPQETITVADLVEPVEQPVLPSPVPRGEALEVDAEALAQFLALSTLLTGFADLNPVLGQVYLESLQQDEGVAMRVAALYDAVGLAEAGDEVSLKALEAGGRFDDPAAQEVANRVVEMWYTGVYTTPDGEQQVATYVDALVWRAMTFTKPPTICGRPGFWAQPPQAAAA